MKTSLITLAFLFMSIGSFSQTSRTEGDGYFLDSIITINYYQEYGPKSNKKIEYYYNLMNLLKVENTYRNINWFPHPDSNEWDLMDRKTVKYNDQNELASEIYESKDNPYELWMFTYKHEYETNALAQTKTGFEWIAYQSSWEASYKEIDSIKDPSIEQSHLSQRWDKAACEWENMEWKYTDYLDNGLIDTFLIMNWWLQGILDTSLIDVYDYTYYPDTTIIYETMNGLTDIYKIFYNSDSSMKHKIFYRKPCDTCNYRTYFKDVYFYDEHDWLLSHSHYNWFNDENRWKLFGKSAFQYNETGQRTQYLYFQFDSLCPRRKTLYQYNLINGLLKTRTEYRDLPDTTHYAVDKYFYSYIYVDVGSTTVAESILLFPNPARTQISFNGIDTETQSAVYSVFGLYGRIILHGKLKNGNTSINISKLVPGNYFVKISIPGKTLSGRFIKY